MQNIVNRQTPSWSAHNLTVLSAEAVINSGYSCHCLQAGQFTLQQPWQRSTTAHTHQPQAQPPAGSKRLFNGEPKQCVRSAAHQQQLQKDIDTILQAHRQLLQCCDLAELGTEAQPKAPELIGSATAEPKTAADAAGVSDAFAVSSAADEGPADWLAVASMKHVLKPKLSFHYIDQQGQQHLVHSKLFDAVISNPSSKDVVATAYDTQVLLPARCSFCMSDMKGIQPFVQAVQEQGGADLLLVDPPWENASARRSAAYRTLTPNHLLYLPVKDMVRQARSSLVALWVTNRLRMHSFIQRQLLPAWGLQHVATWFWLKVTDSGEPVTPLGSLHRHPFEQLWLLKPLMPPQQQQQNGRPEFGSQSEARQAAAATQVVLPATSTASLQATSAADECQVLGAPAKPVAVVSAIHQGCLSTRQNDMFRSVDTCLTQVGTEVKPEAAGGLQVEQQQRAAAAVVPTTVTNVAGGDRTATLDAVETAAPGRAGVLCEGATIPRQLPTVLQPPDHHVIVSVPGAHSRKPHVRHLLLPCVQLSGNDTAPKGTCHGGNSTAAASAVTSAAEQVAGQAERLNSDQNWLVDTAVTGAERCCIGDCPVSSEVSGDAQHSEVAGKQSPIVVELFARELFPGCMSWGNEVLKFQGMEYWQSAAE